LIAGLGNPGKEYEKTRHNLGFVVLDALLQELTPVEKTIWEKNNKFNCLMVKIDDLILVKPQTFMNNSGQTVQKITRFYNRFAKTPLSQSRDVGKGRFQASPVRFGKALESLKTKKTPDYQSGEAYRIKPEDIWIVHDDVDLPLGKIKIRLGGAAAGHHGVESVIEKLGTDQFVRFRVGIGHPREKGKLEIRSEKLVEGYVLKEFDVNEASEVKQMVKKAVQAINIALEKGLEKTMSRFNQ